MGMTAMHFCPMQPCVWPMHSLRAMGNFLGSAAIKDQLLLIRAAWSDADLIPVLPTSVSELQEQLRRCSYQLCPSVPLQNQRLGRLLLRAGS